ncbi:MAG: DUF2845 domain-containing protein [Syntrophales bacterium LBB04]|nr:DUF2845 domain-containing protein [Syntrophales bacterium LBB04]
MKKTAASIFAGLIMFGTAYSSDFMRQSDSFRCGKDVVLLGDNKADVLVKCGTPQFTEVEGGKTTTQRGLEGSPDAYESETVKIEKWYYNQGPSDFIYVLTFYGGNLRSIERGGRGN